MKSYEVREKYLKYFEKNGHKIIPSSSLVPENDPTTLFTGSGMQPMVPYLLGKDHPEGKRITDSQKAFRSGDIDDVGDNRHTTFFEMLGNWSLGDYFKKEQIEWMFDFLVNEIGIDPKRLFVTVFIGDSKNNIPKDTESASIWKELFKSKGIDAPEKEIGSEEDGYKIGMKIESGEKAKIFYYDSKKNWWSRSGIPENMPAGEPGGPDSEMFFEFEEIEHDKKFGENCHPNCDCGRFLEIGNNVFMEFVKTKTGFDKLPKRNVDFGGGLERIVAVSNNESDIFKTDFFKETLFELEKISKKQYSDEKYTKSFRVILDHLRSSVFLISDGVNPGNTERNYFVRRLLRRSILYFDKLEIENCKLSHFVPYILKPYGSSYPEILEKIDHIKKEIDLEEEKFRKTIKEGLKKIDKESPFILFTTYGFPLELTKEIATERGFEIDQNKFNEEMEKHKELSKQGSIQKFKGGLGDTSEISLKYHTATHLLHKALREILGEHVEQRGSNITPERLRFDFSHPQKMTDEEKKKVEDIVNEKINQKLDVINVILPKEEALKIGAMHLFSEKYGDQVSVYYIGESLENAYSKEFCGGPHVKNTSELGLFKIVKEEAVSAGIRRIKAVLK